MLDKLAVMIFLASQFPGLTVERASALVDALDGFVVPKAPRTLMEIARNDVIVVQECADGRKIQAIKRLREIGRDELGVAAVSLKDAKDVCDVIYSEVYIEPPSYNYSWQDEYDHSDAPF